MSLIQTLHEGLLAEGVTVPIARLCAWFGVLRRTVYYKPAKAAPKVDPRFAETIKAMIEAGPSFGYRTVARLQQSHRAAGSASSRCRRRRLSPAGMTSISGANVRSAIRSALALAPHPRQTVLAGEFRRASGPPSPVAPHLTLCRHPWRSAAPHHSVPEAQDHVLAQQDQRTNVGRAVIAVIGNVTGCG